jgi:Tfp pilus tip-associated adhesin PilY1
VFNKIVYFSTFTPTTGVGCDNGGSAKLYGVQMLTGLGGVNFATGEAIGTSSCSVPRSTNIGSGIASMPVVVVTPPGSGGNGGTTVSTSVVTGTTNQELPSNRVPPPAFLKRILYWREVPR